MFDAIIFDMDETLIETITTWQVAEARLFEYLGDTWTQAKASRYKGLNIEGVSREICRIAGSDMDPDVCARYLREQLIESYAEPAPAVPGALALVGRALGWARALGLASGSPEVGIGHAIEMLELQGYFAACVSSESVPRGKPAPDVFLETARQMNVDPQQCLVFEDSYNGALAAKRAGMRCIVRPSVADDRLPEVTDRIVSHWDQVDEPMIAALRTG